MQAVRGIYHNGRITLLETPKNVARARVIVTFLDEEVSVGNPQSMVGTIKILTDDLEGASREVSEEVSATVEKRLAKFNK